ncbi:MULTISPECIES: hypothetical protein [Flavobacterium]|jgi:hypothetical protein|uniref:Uncharacterized protein n=1 Tax=Flavobacterium lindanitolerans TaxID=428988 RepID=A0A497V064_9FLAO|nr:MULTISPECIES: hypothetical protein [Flavobacterium]PZQ82575.1 MAG: hypothetical protein DI548_11885 [Flavobacterium johnsoniae]KQS52693.1 hypothetical protein ASG38_16285 [Flavobacterium sp. Leaf359]MBL7867678.1 hypothetical protein [Flavobacterium lindanitolerans]PKW28930.1 hypothetical protein B0G92_0558 [Flavobacterium lindanitolerans]RLJ35567.1 hypothetical protein CLV50_0948 [Flavobacterium lindanitolerans]
MDIEKLLKQLKQELVTLLGDKYKEFKPEIQKDITAFLDSSKEKLERWTLLLASSSITEEEFSWLLKSQQDLIALKALQGAGLSKIKLNNIKNAIIQTVFKTVLLSI